jgi:hypothetical protein
VGGSGGSGGVERQWGDGEGGGMGGRWDDGEAVRGCDERKWGGRVEAEEILVKTVAEEAAWEGGGAADLRASRGCAAMLGQVRWASASTLERGRDEREQEGLVRG